DLMCNRPGSDGWRSRESASTVAYTPGSQHNCRRNEFDCHSDHKDSSHRLYWIHDVRPGKTDTTAASTKRNHFHRHKSQASRSCHRMCSTSAIRSESGRRAPLRKRWADHLVQPEKI